jgi:hypothetical protein
MDKQNQVAGQTHDTGKLVNSCNVNSRFNFTIGIAAIAAACIIGYFIYQYLKK